MTLGTFLCLHPSPDGVKENILLYHMPTSPEKARASSAKYYETNKEKILEKLKKKRQIRRETDTSVRPVGRPKIISTQ
jgi:hypothetical protein